MMPLGNARIKAEVRNLLQNTTTRGDDTQRLHGHSGLQERTPAPVLHGRQVYNVEVAFRKTSLFNLTPKAHQR